MSGKAGNFFFCSFFPYRFAAHFATGRSGIAVRAVLRGILDIVSSVSPLYLLRAVESPRGTSLGRNDLRRKNVLGDTSQGGGITYGALRFNGLEVNPMPGHLRLPLF